jgi:intracellular sulfur oxidation DsrE/DsrF family protein
VTYPDALSRTKLNQANANDDMQTRILGLKNQGVKFNACANTLKGKQLDREKDLFDVAEGDIVPSGVAELAHLQGQGFSYVKP